MGRDWLKLHTVIVRNHKVMVQLSSDAARWHYVKMLVHAKEASPEGEWRNRDELRLAVGDATFAYFDEFTSTKPEGLVVEDEDGRVYVRQFRYWQKSESELQRDKLDQDALERRRTSEREASKRYRERKRDERHMTRHEERQTERQSVSASRDARLERAFTDDASDEEWRCDVCHVAMSHDEMMADDVLGLMGHEQCLVKARDERWRYATGEVVVAGDDDDELPF